MLTGSAKGKYSPDNWIYNLFIDNTWNILDYVP